MRCRPLILILGLSACKKADQQTAAPAAVPADSATSAAPAQLPAMPSYPAAIRGRMVVVSAGPPGMDSVQRNWPASAVSCDSPSRLIIMSEQPGLGGTILLLTTPVDPLANYPVAPDSTVPSAPAAQLGVQVFRTTGPLTYESIDGTADLSSVGTNVSGRFAMTVLEGMRKERMRYAGTFSDIPLSKGDSASCAGKQEST